MSASIFKRQPTLDTIKAEAEIAKMNAEIMKLMAETIKTSRENRWALLAQATACFAAGAAFVTGTAALIKVLFLH